MGTKRAVNPADKAKFFAAIASGKTIRDAARISGVHVNTGSNWLKKAKLLELLYFVKSIPNSLSYIYVWNNGTIK